MLKRFDVGKILQVGAERNDEINQVEYLFKEVFPKADAKKTPTEYSANTNSVYRSIEDSPLRLIVYVAPTSAEKPLFQLIHP